MAKLKFENIDYQMIIENTLGEYLTNKAKNGLVLHKITFDQLSFEVCDPQNIKYQLEYGETEYEYDDFLNDIGYELVCLYQGISIYKNNDIHAPDLHSDESVRLQSLNKIVNPHPILTVLSILLLCFPLSLIFNFILHSSKTLGTLFSLIEIIPFTLMLLWLAALLIVNIIQSFILKNIIKQVSNNVNPNYKPLYRISKIRSFMFYLLIIIIPFILLQVLELFTNNVIESILHILFTSIAVALIYFILLLKKNRINKRFICMITIFAIVLISGVRQIIDEKINIPETTPVSSSYMKEYTSYQKNNGLLIDSILFEYSTDNSGYYADKYEMYKTCLNEYIAVEVMKDDIINYENETRASPEMIDKILNETGEYSTGDIPFYNYEEALSHLTKYNNELVDECYYDNHFMIVRKDNHILVSYMQDEENYIDNIIEYYFK